MSSCVGPSSFVIFLLLPPCPSHQPHFTDGFLDTVLVNVQVGQAPRESGMENTRSLPTTLSSGTENE